MRRTLTLLLLAVATTLGLAGPAQAYTEVTPAAATTWQAAVADGWQRPLAPTHRDTVGRWDTHPLYGTDHGAYEDAPGFDCRVQGNRTCGSIGQHLAIKDCVIYGQYLDATHPGDVAEDYTVECFAATYAADLTEAHAVMGEWHAEWVEWYNHHAGAGYQYNSGTWY